MFKENSLEGDSVLGAENLNGESEKSDFKLAENVAKQSQEEILRNDTERKKQIEEDRKKSEKEISKLNKEIEDSEVAKREQDEEIRREEERLAGRGDLKRAG